MYYMPRKNIISLKWIMVSTMSVLSGFVKIFGNIAKCQEKHQDFGIFHQNVRNCQDFQLSIAICLVTYIFNGLVTNFLTYICYQEQCYKNWKSWQFLTYWWKIPKSWRFSWHFAIFPKILTNPDIVDTMHIQQLQLWSTWPSLRAQNGN